MQLRLYLCLIGLNIILQGWAKMKFHNYKVMRVHLETSDVLAALKHLENEGHIEFWSDHEVNSTMDVLVSAENVHKLARKLEGTSARYHQVVDNLQRLIDAEYEANELAKAQAKANGQRSPVGTYARLQEIMDWIKSLETSYPTFARVFSIGETWEGRNMQGIRLGYQGVGQKQNILIDSCMHAREWLSCATHLVIIDRLIKNRAREPEKSLLEKYDWWLLPVSNPDGYEFTFTDNRIWRKTRSPNVGSTCIGADPNRNFDAHWGQDGASDSPCTATYSGPYPFSEVEMYNLASLMQYLRPRFHFNLHTFGQIYILPYGYTLEFPSTINELMRVATTATDAMEAVNGHPFLPGPGSVVMYTTSGSIKDYAYDSVGTPYPCTIELRPVSGTPDGHIQLPSEIEPSANEIYAGILAAVQAVN